MKKTVEVTICACSNCMNTGASEIAQAIEALAKIEGLLHGGQEIQIALEKVHTEAPHSEICPVIALGDTVFERATSEVVTTAILEIFKGDE